MHHKEKLGMAPSNTQGHRVKRRKVSLDGTDGASAPNAKAELNISTPKQLRDLLVFNQGASSENRQGMYYSS
jgi:hypothetical protein